MNLLGSYIYFQSHRREWDLYTKSYRQEWFRLNWRLERCCISVCSMAVLTCRLNIEPVIGPVLQNDYSSWKTKTPFVARLLYLCNVSHISPEINSNIHSPGVCCAFLCVPVFLCVCAYVSPVAELMISARVFFFFLLLIVRLTIAVNDSPELLHGSTVGDGRPRRGKPIFKSIHGFYS